MNQPNIILIVMDSLRADRLGCYGYGHARTPNIDALAGEGAMFEAAYSESSWTLPVSFTLMTGLAPREHRAEAHRRLPIQIPTLAEALKLAGYSTFAVSANAFFGPRCSLNRGFDHFYWAPHVFRVAKPFTKYVGGALGLTDAGGSMLTDHTIRHLGRMKSPWLCVIWYNDSHTPYLVPQWFLRASGRRTLPLGRRIHMQRRMHHLSDFAATASSAELAELSEVYDTAVAYTDALLGRLREGLGRQGLWDDSMVITTADHGQMLGERGMMGHGKQAGMYRPLIRVPLILKAPGQAPAGVRSASLVQIADIPHTLASRLGVEEALAPTAAHCTDIIKAVSGPGREYTVSERDQFSERSLRAAHKENPRFDFAPHQCHMIAVARGDWRLIYRSNGHHELYNVKDDPAEARDLFTAEPEIARSLESLVCDWQERAHPHSSVRGLEAPVNRAVERHLQALGYY